MMALIAKAYRIKQSSPLPVGVNLVFIKDIHWARNKFKQYLVTKDGEMCMEIVFANDKGENLDMRIWMTDKSIWILQKLCKCLDIPWDGQATDVSQIVNRELFICVAEQYLIVDGQRKKDLTGKEIVEYVILPEFYKKIRDSRPRILGDPQVEGVASGKFIIEREIAA